MNDKVIECPCHRVCSLLEVATGRWCRYRESQVPPPGMHSFDPKDTWCPAGMQASVIMLGYMLAGEKRGADELGSVLAEVREWARSLQAAPATMGLGTTAPGADSGSTR